MEKMNIRLSLSWIFMLLLLVVISALGLISCSEEEFEGVNIGPPNNLVINVDIKNDDSGEVMVLPQAEGVAYFVIDYGDPDNNKEEIKPGEIGTNVYPEGNYTIKVIAYNLDGQSVEGTKNIDVQFIPPENLIVDIVIDPVNTNMITVTPTADNAMVFDIFFGDENGGDPTTINAGESASHTYETSGTFEVLVIARSASSTTIDFTEVLEIVKPLKQLTLPIDFEDDEISYDINSFGNAELSVVENPDKNGNTSNTVGRFVKTMGAETWAGGFLQLPEPIDFSASTTFTLDVWSPKENVPVLFKIENESNNQTFVEIQVATTVINQWETLSFDFSGVDMMQEYHKVIVFMDFGQTGDGTEYFFDNINLGDPVSNNNEIALPLSFEDVSLDYGIENFGSATTEIIGNPDPSELNMSDYVLHMNKAQGAETWAGSFVTLSDPIDFGEEDHISIKSWSPKADVTVLLKLENISDGNIFFESQSQTSVTNEWEILSFDLSGIDLGQTYQKVVVFYDFGNPGDGSDYYFDDIVLGMGDTTMEDILDFPIDFESDQVVYDFTDFGNATTEIIENPDMSGDNTSSMVASLQKADGAEVWAGSFITMPTPIDLNGVSMAEVKVWSPKSGINILFKLENATDGNIFYEIQQQNTAENTWETIRFDLTSLDAEQSYQKVVIFFDFGNRGDGTVYYFDEIDLK